MLMGSLLSAVAEVRFQRVGHYIGGLGWDRPHRRRFAHSCGILVIPFPVPPPQDTVIHDTFSATPWQGWAVRVSTSGGKGAFSASVVNPQE